MKASAQIQPFVAKKLH